MANIRAKLRKYLFPALILVIVLFSIYINSWPMFTGDFGGRIQNVEIPSDYYIVHKWLRDQKEDFRVLMLPMSYGILVNWSQEWIHDPFFASPPKPVITGGGIFASPVSRQFVTFLGNLIAHEQTINYGKILGVANVKYILFHTDVLGGSGDWWQPHSRIRESLLQGGFKLVNHTSSFYIFENEHFAPHFFVTPQASLIVGSRNFLGILSNLVNIKNNVLFFAEQFKSEEELRKIFGYTGNIILQERGILDLALTTLDEKYLNILARYVAPVKTSDKYWVKSTYYDLTCDLYNKGEFYSEEGFIYTTGKGVKINIPIFIETSQNYEIWLRLLYGPERGEIRVDLDGTPVSQNLNSSLSYFAGFRWTKLGELNISAGSHTITLVNVGSHETVIDRLAIVPPQVLDMRRSHWIQTIREASNKSLIYFFEAEDFKLQGWQYTRSIKGSNNFIISSTGPAVAEAYLNIPRPGLYSIAIKAAVGRDYGNISLNVDDRNFIINNHYESSKMFKYQYVGSLFLEAGNHKIFISNANSSTEIDHLFMYSNPEGNPSLHVEDLFKFSSIPDTLISFKQRNPTNYKVHVKASRPFFLVFSESYSPLWKAHVDGEEAEHILVYSFLNGYYIDKIGEYDFAVNYGLQSYKTISLIASGVFLLTILIYMTGHPKLWIGRITSKLKMRLPFRSKKLSGERAKYGKMV